MAKPSAVPCNSIPTRRHLVILGLVSAVVVYRMFAFEFSHENGLLVDDAYISVRHANNWVDGHGLTFNAGERVEGYTNFLFTVLLAVPHLFGIALTPFVRSLGFMAGLLSIVLTGLLTEQLLGGFAALLIACAMALDARFIYLATWGLETIFVTVPYLLAFLLLFRRKEILAGVAFACAAMTRIETVILVLPAALYILLQRKLPPRERLGHMTRLVVTFGLLFGSYFCGRWWYYGWLLPNTFYAKVGSPTNAWHRGMQYVHDSLSNMGVLPIVLVSALAWIVHTLVVVAFRSRLKELWPKLGQSATILFGTVLYFSYIIAVGGDHFQERFVYHTVPLLFISVMAPWALTARFAMEVSGNGSAGTAFTPLLTLAGGMSLIIPLATHPDRFGSSDSVAAWMSLGRYLRQHATRGAVLATDAAGALPFASELTTIDLLGLADVHIAHRKIDNLGAGPAGHEKSDPAYVLERAPTYISTWLDPDGEPGRGFRRLPNFHDEYELSALVRIDSSRVTAENVLSFAVEPSYPEIVALSEGRGQVPGQYRWALYQRRGDGSVRTFRNDEFRSNLPDFRPSTDYIVFAPAGHVPAHIMWGPFATLVPGNYAGTVHMTVGKVEGVDPRQRVCALDVFDGARSLAEVPMTVGAIAGRTEKVPFNFEVTSEGASRKYEFRMYCWGLADVKIISVCLSRE